MRSLLVLFLAFFLAAPSIAHEGEAHQHYYYVMLTIELNGGAASLDDGTVKSSSKLFRYSEDRELVDDNGETIEFNTAADALNYMASWGWELVEAVSVVQSGGYQGNLVGVTKIVYIMRVEVNGDEDDISHHTPPMKKDK